MLRGAPGMDVFATGDPMNSGWTNPNYAFRLAHMGLDVDDTEMCPVVLAPARLSCKTVCRGALPSIAL